MEKPLSPEEIQRIENTNFLLANNLGHKRGKTKAGSQRYKLIDNTWTTDSGAGRGRPRAYVFCDSCKTHSGKKNGFVTNKPNHQKYHCTNCAHNWVVYV
jgi:hypothetical protein